LFPFKHYNGVGTCGLLGWYEEVGGWPVLPENPVTILPCNGSNTL